MHNDLACTYPIATTVIPIMRNNSPVIRTGSALDVDCGCWDGTGGVKVVLAIDWDTIAKKAKAKPK